MTDFGPDPRPLGRGGEGYCHVTNSWPVSDGPCSLQASRVSTFRKGDKGLGKNIQSRGNFCEQYIPLIVSLKLEQQQQGAA